MLHPHHVAAVLIYLTGPSAEHLRRGADALTPATASLRDAGYRVYTAPALRGLSRDRLRRILPSSVEALLRADGLAILPGWETSPTALVDLLTAQGAGIPWAPVAEWLLDTASRLA